VKRAILQEPQQLRLQWPAHVGDFVEKYAPAVRLLHPPGLLFQRARERPLFMAEKFALSSVSGIAAQLMRHITRLPSLAQGNAAPPPPVPCPCRFPQDQHPRVRRRHGQDHLPQFMHPGRLATIWSSW